MNRRNGLVIVMVGLPARGKTFIARKLARYLSWLGTEAKVFNVGNYRREKLGKHQPHSFFDPDNPEGFGARKQMAELALADMLEWLSGDGEVAIYDATNSTVSRRAWVSDTCTKQGFEVLFVESICTNPALIDSNVRNTKLRSPDYVGVDPEQAVTDFRARIAHYERAYQTLTEAEGSYVQLINVGSKVVTHHIHGYLPSRIVYFLMNLHIEPRPIWLTRHGESLFNLENRVGGDPPLSGNGDEYAKRLAQWFQNEHADLKKVVVYTSTLQRTQKTAELLPYKAIALKSLEEIDAGLYDGLRYEEIETFHPEEYEARKADKFRYRYPRGESYQDVIRRLEPVIIEIERQRSPVLVIAHQAVLRALYAYLMNIEPAKCPFLPIPLHTVMELTPQAYGCVETRHELGPTAKIASSS